PSRHWPIRPFDLASLLWKWRFSRATSRHRRRSPPCRRPISRNGGRSSRNSGSRQSEEALSWLHDSRRRRVARRRAALSPPPDRRHHRVDQARLREDRPQILLPKLRHMQLIILVEWGNGALACRLCLQTPGGDHVASITIPPLIS